MLDHPSHQLTLAISSRALFDFEEANRVFVGKGLAAYRQHQRKNANALPQKGAAFDLVKGLLGLNTPKEKLGINVVVISRNSKHTSQRLSCAIRKSGLRLPPIISIGRRSLHQVLTEHKVDLLLSRDNADVREAMANGIAAALLSIRPREYLPNDDAVCIAFDGDAVLFSPDSELIYKTQGLSAFLNHEIQNADTPMGPGPFANVLMSLAKIQSVNKSRLRLALVSARNQSAGTRVIKTLNEWGIDLNEIHFLGGNEKSNLLAAIKTHIFFDDQEVHINPASKLVPAALVPCFALEGLKEDRPQVSPMHEKKVELRLALDKPC